MQNYNRKFNSARCFIFFCYTLFNPFIHNNQMCNAMLMSNPKMSDICWGNGDIFVDPQNIPLLLYYFRSCLQATELLETSDKQSLLETLLSRINSVVPEIKFVYYNGNIDYDIIENMNDLINEIKFMEISYNDPQVDSYRSRYDFNNLGNAYNYINDRMYRSPSFFKAPPLKITASLQDQKQACNLLMLKNKASGNKSSNSKNYFESSKKDYVDKMVPVPVLHSVNNSPRSLAVPLKSRSIYPVNSKESRDILIRYYVTSMKCLSLNKKHPKEDIFEFNKEFCSWLDKEVMPRILQHEYYQAFSGVFQILETMQMKGMAEDCIDRINKRQSKMLKKNRGKDLNIASYLDNSTKLIKTKSKSNKSDDLLDYVDLLQTMVPVVGASYVGTPSEITSNGITSKLQSQQSTEVLKIVGLSDQISMFVNFSPKHLFGIFAILLAIILATWTVAGSLCFARVHQGTKKDSESPDEPSDSQNTVFGGGGVCSGGGGAGCPYEPGESVIIMMKDELGNPQYYYGTFHLDKNKISENRFFEKQGACETCSPSGDNVCSDICGNSCGDTCGVKTCCDHKSSSTTDRQTNSEPNSDSTQERPTKRSSTVEESGSSKAQIGSSEKTPLTSKHSKKCPCPCSKGEEHYDACRFKGSSKIPSQHSLLLDQSFTPQHFKRESVNNMTSVASASNTSHPPQQNTQNDDLSEEVEDNSSIVGDSPQSTSETTETSESAPSGTGSPQSSHQKIKEQKKKETGRRASIDTTSTKKTNKSKGKK